MRFKGKSMVKVTIFWVGFVTSMIMMFVLGLLATVIGVGVTWTTVCILAAAQVAVVAFGLHSRVGDYAVEVGRRRLVRLRDKLVGMDLPETEVREEMAQEPSAPISGPCMKPDPKGYEDMRREIELSTHIIADIRKEESSSKDDEDLDAAGDDLFGPRTEEPDPVVEAAAQAQEALNDEVGLTTIGGVVRQTDTEPTDMPELGPSQEQADEEKLYPDQE